MVVVDGVGEVLEDGGDAEEDDVEQHIQQVTEGQAEHHSFLGSFSWGFFFAVFYLGNIGTLLVEHFYLEP